MSDRDPRPVEPQSLESLAVPGLTDQERDAFLAAIFDDDGSPLDRLAAWCDDRSVDRYREATIRSYAATENEVAGVAVVLYAAVPAARGRTVAKAFEDTTAEAIAAALAAAESPSGVTR